jgi:sterol desaturase/sphingolipid hydroxylase (fatty acid hydroxylase superfamily)
LGIAPGFVDNRGVDTLGPFWTSYIAFGVIVTVVELLHPARKLRYRRTLPRDVVAMLVYQFGVTTAAAYLCAPIVGFALRHLSAMIAGIWLPPRIVLYYLVADLGSYWMHRLLHTRHLWRFHRWHHAPEQMWWLSGVRATVQQQVLFNLPYILALPILSGGPDWIGVLVIVESVIRNDWMHMNVTWRSHWLERVLVTPRYHHIHHSTDAELHDGNYASLFSIWDRLFGTYVDPDATSAAKFGTGEPRRDPVLLALGI